MPPFLFGVIIMTTSDQIDLASKACVLLGANQISSFEEETTEGLAVRTFYDLVYESCLVHRNWSFAKRTLRLSEIEETPEEWEFNHTYRIGVDILKIINVQNQASKFVRVTNRKIYTNIPNAFAVCLTRTDEQLLPADFKLAFIHLLAAAMATTITDDSSQQVRFEEKGAVLMKQAGANDAVQGGNLTYSTDSDLVDTYGEGFHGGY